MRRGAIRRKYSAQFSAARNRLTTATAAAALGIKPHLYCLPILKREEDRQALLAGIRTGCDRLFLGTDSAPHAVGRKESACGCAGVFSAHCALELCAARDIRRRNSGAIRLRKFS